LISTAPLVDGLFILDCDLERALELIEFTDIGSNCLLALMTTGYASRQDSVNQLLLHRCLAHIDLKAFKILVKVVSDTLKLTVMWECASCTPWKFA
jgi:hypothetical protein